MKSEIKIIPMAADSMFAVAVKNKGAVLSDCYELVVTTHSSDEKNSATINFPIIPQINTADDALLLKINYALDNTREKLQYYLNQNKKVEGSQQ